MDKETLYTSSLTSSKQVVLACLYIADKVFLSEDIQRSMQKGLGRIVKSISAQTAYPTDV